MFLPRAAHRCLLPVSSVGDAVAATVGAFDAVQTHASGVFGSPVATHLQARWLVFWIKKSLVIMVPPRAVRAGARDPDAPKRNPAGPGTRDCWFGRVSQIPAAHTLNSRVVCREERCGNRR